MTPFLKARDFRLGINLHPSQDVPTIPLHQADSAYLGAGAK